ncbi:hypothetical protein HMPREF3187_01367 [Aerococcus christensenii]|uniref:Uncharacterized protein n=1 Tax=Aerococcus christensenii TaxID=87541 RepID=A0A133XUK8_9LACT|nr:hypothetical protein HMPREF3187_01367 [Aerococcus christensenii]
MSFDGIHIIFHTFLSSFYEMPLLSLSKGKFLLLLFDYYTNKRTG